MKKVFLTGFKITLPVFVAYLFLGAAVGLSMASSGYSVVWVLLCSLTVYAGSGQFLLAELLTSAYNLVNTAAMTLSVNSRYMFYGLTFLEKFKTMGKWRLYMIFALTDETYSILASLKTPEEMNENHLMIAITLMNHVYWILGTCLGALAGKLIRFDMKGIEFSMLALFVVIFVEQWQSESKHLPVFLGFACALSCVFLFPASVFVLPALLLTVVCLVLLQKPIMGKEAK